MKLLSLCLVLAACGGSQSTSPSPAAPATPLELPEYPGGMMGGVSGGPDLTALTIATDPIAMVRAFYTPEHLKGFEVTGGAATKASPLKLRDVPGHREYSIAIYEENGVTMIASTTHVVP